MSETTLVAKSPARQGNGLYAVPDVLDHLKHRKEHREIVAVNRVADLGLRWEDAGAGKSKEGFYARIDGVDMRLTQGAEKTANRLISGPADLRHWKKYQDPNAFPKALANILDNDASKRTVGTQLIHNGLEVTALLPSDYVTIPAYDMMSDMLDSLGTNLGDIQGLDMVETGWGDFSSFRVVMGNNIMPELDADKGQFMMFLLSMSENGQCDARTSLGLYRTFCTNSAIRTQTISKWNHKSSNKTRFLQGTGNSIRMAGLLQSQFEQVFSEMFKTPLELGAVELLEQMKQLNVIPRDHYDAALSLAKYGYEGKGVETHYDLFNVLTKSAQDLPSVQAREQAEENAMNLFTAQGGVYRELQRAAGRRPSRGGITN